MPTKQSGWLRICGLMQERVSLVQTPLHDTSRCDQQLKAAPYWHMGSISTPVCWLSDSVVRSTRRSTLGDRAFPVAAARAWNSLSPAVRDAPSLLTFRSRLKTWLFELTLAWHWRHSPAALHFVFYFNNSVKCPCNVIHDSVTLIFTFLIIIIIISQNDIDKAVGKWRRPIVTKNSKSQLVSSSPQLGRGCNRSHILHPWPNGGQEETKWCLLL